MKALSLYSGGCDGLSLAASWCGIETLAYCDSEAACRAVLRSRHPDAPIFESDEDVTIDGLQERGITPGDIDLIMGGPPCQIASVAGKRLGAGDERNRWPEFLRIVPLWPTPTAEPCGMTAKTGNRPLEKSTKLQTQVYLAENWPTPTVNGNYNRAGSSANAGDGLATAVRWPTHKAADYRSGMASREDRTNKPRDLNDSVLKWNTPTVNDARNATLPLSQTNRDALTGDLIREGTKGQLNPDWVETLQGYPIGWTKLPDGWKSKGGRRAKARSSTTGSRPE